MPQQVKTFQSFQNMDEYGNMMVPSDKMDEIKRRSECISRALVGLFHLFNGKTSQLWLITVTLLPIRFTSVRVTAKYHGIKLEYRELRHTVLDLLGQIKAKLCVWGRPFISPEAVRMLLQEWHVSGSGCEWSPFTLMTGTICFILLRSGFKCIK